MWRGEGERERGVLCCACGRCVCGVMSVCVVCVMCACVHVFMCVLTC